MNGVGGASSAHHVIKQVVHKVPLKAPDESMYSIAAGQPSSRPEHAGTVDQQSDASDEKVNEAFAKMKVAMQNIPNIQSSADAGASSEVKNGSDVAEGSAVGKKSASEQFMDFMHLSPREKIRQSALADLGMTKDQYDNLSPADKAKVDKKIDEKMKKEAELAAHQQSTPAANTREVTSAVNTTASADGSSADESNKKHEKKSMLEMLTDDQANA